MSLTPTALRASTARAASVAVVDLAIAAAAVGGSLALVAHGASGVTHSGSGGLDLLSVVLLMLSAAPVAMWRRAPLGAFALSASASVLLAGLGYSIGFPLGATGALYLLVASRDQARSWNGRTTTVVVGFFVAYVGATAAAQATFPGIEIFHTALAWAVAWFAGERTRLSREHLADLTERAARAEREAERERLLAVAEERARIARDLHDSAGHAISLIAVRAGTARLRHHQDPDRSVVVLQAIENLARQTAGDIDQFVGVLRDTDSRNGAVEAPPGLASLDTLVSQHAAAGLDVTLATAGILRQLSPGADQAVFRILQEALTNAARHGAGTARIELGFGNEAFELVVINPLPPEVSACNGGGHGLVGMRERASLLGGDLVAEGSAGAFRVRARLPYGGHGP
ncbi:MAG: sensor histidine kinase [Acidimicrobiales bacterium]